MQKEFYTKPETEVTCFKTVDILTESGVTPSETTTTDDNFVDDPFAS